jgi:rRNA maturation RNase YbeY
MAFPMANISGEGFDSSMLGDVVISVDTALRESKECGESLEYTIERLLIHGVLHLSGYDHEESDSEADRMEKEEKRLIALIGEDSENGTVGS